MTNRRQLQYNIPFFFFFYKVFREKNSYRPGKNAVRSNFSLFHSLMLAASLSPPLGSASECTMYREERLECGLDRRELHTSTATWLRSAVDIQLSWTKRTKTVTRLLELYSGTKFPPCVLVFFFVFFCCILGLIKGQRSTRKKRQGQIIESEYTGELVA